MIHLPPHRTKGPGAVGTSGPGQAGPFGRWPDPDPDVQDHPLAETKETNR
ncbi:hypothetical protein ACIOWI_34835 [Streptomyces sp. NPDC087659]